MTMHANDRQNLKLLFDKYGENRLIDEIENMVFETNDPEDDESDE